MSSTISVQVPSSATTGRQAINLDNLARELLLLIAFQIPDLVSLDSLIRASPAFYRLFNTNAVEMTEAVLTFGHTHRHIQVIIRIVASIRSSSLPAPSLQYFRSHATGEAMWRRLTPSKDAISPLYLAKDTTSEVLREIMATNRKLTSLALDCLKFYLARFQTLKPDHPITEVSLGAYRSTQNVQGQRFVRNESGPPDWVEEQRALRAFWRIQLIYDLKQAASSLSWSEADLVKLHEIHPMQMYQDYGFDYDSDLRLGRHGEGEPHPEYHEISSVYDYVRDVHGEYAERASAFKPIPNAGGEVCREWPTAVPESSSWTGLTIASAACYFFHYPLHQLGKTASIKFEWYRQWGFAFWTTRMYDAGFLNNWRTEHPNAPNRHSIYMFAWESILPVEHNSFLGLFPDGDPRLPSSAATLGP